MEYSLVIYDSPLGKLLIKMTKKGITEITLMNKKSNQIFHFYKGSNTYMKQLKNYFSGVSKTINLPLDISGTDFQKAVWTATLKIPYGKTATYSDIAKMIGKPKAVRAVGTALAKNPVCIVIPCHRVLPKTGGIGKYALGEKVKKWLLQHEK